MHFKPYEHQAQIIDQITGGDVSLILAGMGLGKTASTLEAYSRRILDGETKGVLIVAPLRVAVLTWPDEKDKWENFSWFKMANLRTEEGVKAWQDGSAQFYCINYEMLPKFIAKHVKGRRKSQMPVDAVVFDEITLAKSHKSKRINAFRKYAFKFPTRTGLTGTPLPNSHEDLFAQVRLLDDGARLGKYVTHYQKTYFQVEDPFADYPKFTLAPGAKGLIEEKIADITTVLRSEDWLDIPPTHMQDIEVAMGKTAQRVYNEMLKLALVDLETGVLHAANAAVRVNKLLQIAGGSCYKTDELGNTTKEVEIIHNVKIQALKKLAKQENAPILVAANFRHEIERIKTELGAVEFSDDCLDDWNAGKIKLLVAHPKSIGHGLNLQKGGSRVCWFSPNYSNELTMQFNARLARTGQKSITKVFRIICPGSIDDAVIAALDGKKNNENVFMQTLVNLKRLAKK